MNETKKTSKMSKTSKTSRAFNKTPKLPKLPKPPQSRKPPNSPKPLGQQKREENAVLAVEGLGKKFSDKTILSDISFTAERGDVLSILGASGTGKSTLLRCLNFLEYPSAGRISLNGERMNIHAGGEANVTKAEHEVIRRFRRKMAMVFQQFNLWAHLTALENVMLAPVNVLGIAGAEAKKEGLSLLEKVGMQSFAHQYPSKLSGGQKQRVAIARALAMRPQVLLFDEPTSALDPELVNEVLQVIKNLAREKMTMLIVSHEMEFSRNVSNKTLFLHGGKIEEMGETQTVFRSGKSKRFKSFLKAGKL